LGTTIFSLILLLLLFIDAQTHKLQHDAWFILDVISYLFTLDMVIPMFIMSTGQNI
jgi:hypothetical protein